MILCKEFIAVHIKTPRPIRDEEMYILRNHPNFMCQNVRENNIRYILSFNGENPVRPTLLFKTFQPTSPRRTSDALPYPAHTRPESL